MIALPDVSPDSPLCSVPGTGGERLGRLSLTHMNDPTQHPDDFANSFRVAFARLQIAIETVCAPEPDWPRRVAAGIRAALEFAAAHPDDAGLLTNGALAAGREGFERYDRMLDHFAGLCVSVARNDRTGASCPRSSTRRWSAAWPA